MTVNSPSRLYLAKKDGSLHIDKCQLEQHQIDAVRFMYKQFKKKKPGVIFNGPLHSGKPLALVSFLNAISSLLTNRVLILCDEDVENDWMELFKKWSVFGNEVCIETTHPYKTKKIIINPMKNLQAFASRQRTILVVHTDDPSKDLLKTSFKADFKIWICSRCLKENLETFSTINSWLYPKEKFDINLFISKENNPNDVIEKSIWFDAFTEDVLIRSYPFNINNCVKENTILHKTPIKNKDITGKKIKRTKTRNTHEVVVKRAKKKTVPLMYDDESDEENYVCEAKDHESTGEKKDVELFIKEENTINSDQGKCLEETDTISTFEMKQENIEVDSVHEDLNNEIRIGCANDISVGDITVTGIEVIEESNDESMKLIYSETDTVDIKNNSNDQMCSVPDSNEFNIELNNELDDFKDEMCIEHNVDEQNIQTQLNRDVSDETNTDSEMKNECTPEETRIDLINENLNSDVIVDVQNDIDSKLKKYEEICMKKFNGSFLDKLL